jgi:hypothetical protein
MARRLLLTLIVLLAAGCSIENQQGEPRCDGGNTWNISAQSVPTASLVFCFDRLPDGWHVDNTQIDQDGTLIRFDSDRAGDDAAIFHYTATCEIGDAVYTVSDHEGADRYENIEQIPPGFRAQRYYTFEGGCLWWEFDFDGDATSSLSIELGDRLVTFTRDEMNAAVRESFIDEDL